MPTTVEVMDVSGNTIVSPGVPCIVPASLLLIGISGAVRDRVRLDGRKVVGRTVGDRLVVAADFSNATGFHHLDLGDGAGYWLGTEDDKLRLDGMRAMLEYLRGHSLGWTGELFFSDGSKYRDPHVVYGWLDLHADAALDAAEDIALRPRWGSQNAVRVSRRGGVAPLIRPTMRLLRQRPRELLEEVSEGRGSLRVGGRELVPLAVVRRDSHPSVNIPANRRVAWLVGAIRQLAQEVIASDPAELARTRCVTWIERSGLLATGSLLRGLRTEAGVQGASPAAEEQIDTRYVRTHQTVKQLIRVLGWSPAANYRSLHSYVSAVDQIYQAFVAHVVAESIGAKASDSPAGQRRQVFESDRWELYVNVVPPPGYLRSWRSFTGAPDHYRPDLLFVEKETGRVVIGDAKYRQDGRRASESSRRDVSVYMATYGLREALIFYPPESEALVMGRIAEQERAITEIGITPSPYLPEFAAAAIEPLLNSIAEHPPWVD